MTFSKRKEGLSCDSAGKESACDVEDLGSIHALGRSPGEGNSYLPQYSDLENSMDCIVHGIAKSQTQISNFHFHFSFKIYMAFFFQGHKIKNELTDCFRHLF